MQVSLKQRQLKVVESARFGEQLLVYERPHSLFLDPEFGEFKAGYYHFIKGMASHPSRKKPREGHGKVSWQEAERRINEKNLPISILQYGGSSTAITIFEDVDFGPFKGKLCNVLRGKRSHPRRHKLNLCIANKKSWENPVYVEKVREGQKKVDLDAREEKRKQTCFKRYGGTHWQHRNLIYTSLIAKCPDLLDQLHPTRNTNVSSLKIHAGSKNKVWWICQKGHEWISSIVDRVRKHTGCPYCAGKRACKENSLETLYPEIAKQWHPSANGSLAPCDVTAKSHRKVSWKCPVEADHEWEATIANRTNGSGCPCCSGQKIVNSNCLAVQYPHLANEFHSTLNGSITPFNISNSQKKVYWQCVRDSSHIWKVSTNNRISNKTGCPFCRESHGERAIRDFLDSRGIEYHSQYSFDDCRNIARLRFDFAIFKDTRPMMIEFHGMQHYESINHFGGDKSLRGTIHRDRIKASYCKEQMIPMLVIPYWEIERIDNVLERFLKEIHV